MQLMITLQALLTHATYRQPNRPNTGPQQAHKQTHNRQCGNQNIKSITQDLIMVLTRAPQAIFGNFNLLARGQECATARGRAPRQRTRSERRVPPLRGASSFCVDTILAERPVVPQRLRPKPSSLKRATKGGTNLLGWHRNSAAHAASGQ